MISRRSFLGTTTVGIVGITPAALTHAAGSETIGLAALVCALREQAAFEGYVVEREEVEQLEYALARVRPRTPVELAFCVRCARPHSTADLVDEYVRRRAGQPARLPDHPALALEGRGLPSTERMLVFREQIEGLIAALTDASRRQVLEIYYPLFRGKIGIEELASLLCDRWRARDRSEIATLYEAIRFYQRSAMPYTWCSAIVDRATVLARGSGRWPTGLVAHAV